MANEPSVFDANYPDTTEYDGSVATARQFLQAENPELYQGAQAARSDRAHFDKEVGARKHRVGPMEKMGAVVSQMNTFINFDQANQLEAARKVKSEINVSDSQLVDALPAEFHALVLDENFKFGSTAAITLKEQLLEDIKNNTIMDNLEWYETLGYGVAQAVVDPTTYIGAAGGVAVGANASKVAAKSARLLGKSLPKEADTLIRYGAASGVEAAATNAPRLAGDHTYTVEDYHADLVVDTLMGTGLVYGGDKLFKKYSSYQSQNSIRRQTAQDNIDQMKRELDTGKAETADFDPAKPVTGEVPRTRRQGIESNIRYAATIKGDMSWTPEPSANTAFESKLDDVLEYPHFKVDNDMDWMGTKLTALAMEVKELNKFRNRIDMSDAVAHPAFTSPTKKNVEDLAMLVDEKINKAYAATSAQAKVEADRIELGRAVGTEADTRNMTPESREAWDVLVDNDVATRRKIGVDAAGQPEYAFKLKTGDSGSQSLPERPKDVAPEMAAVLAKIKSQRVQARINGVQTARRTESAKPYSTIKYVEGYDQPQVKMGDYPVETKATEAIVKVHKEREAIVQKNSVDMEQKVKSSDEIPKNDIVTEVNALKEAQQDARTVEGAEGGILDLDLSTGVLQSAEDSAMAVLDNPGVAKEVGDSLLRKSVDKITQTVSNYHGSGEHKVYQRLLRPKNIKQWAARAVSQWGGVTQDLATKFIETDNATLNWVGTHLTEMGRGYGGDVMRKHTAGVIRESEYMRSVSKIMPDYDKAVKEYAASKGSKAVGQMMAAVSTGGRNKLQDEFAHKFMVYMNEARLGRALPDEPVVAKFAQKWNEYMGHNYDTLVRNKIAGFTGDNRINNYVPQVWHVKHAQRLINDDEGTIMELLTRAVRGPEEDAHALMAWLKKAGDDYDGYLANQDSRAIERLNVDWSVEHNGVKVLDLLETDTRRIMTNYSNRVAGWAGVSKASGGKLVSHTDLNALKLSAFEQNQSLDDAMIVSDTLDMLFGRPVQGGLQDWQRSAKTAAVLTQLGGLGSAQLIESGTVATRAVMESMGDPKFMKKLLKGMSPEETAKDLRELQALTGNGWDYHLINVEAEYYTEYDLAGTSKLQNSVDWAVDKATLGGLKPVAGRAFGHVTGYNMVRKYQAAMMQRSFAMQVARYFKNGQSKMSVERMADYGLTDVDGSNVYLQRAIREHVEFDAEGYPTKYNFDKWPPSAKDTFMYAMQRAEATELLRPLVGEMPEWFNKPWMQMLMQFRTMPVVAQNKALGRSLAFADKEAVAQLMLNTMTAGLVRYGKYAGLAALAAGTTGSWEDEYKKQIDRAGNDALLGGAVDRYITQLGGVADVYALSHIYGSAETPSGYVSKMANQVPTLSLMKDYAGAAEAISEGDMAKASKHVQGITFLGNTLALEAAGSVIEEAVKGD